MGGSIAVAEAYSEANLQSVYRSFDHKSIYNCTQLSERSEELLPILEQFCCSGMKPLLDSSSKPAGPISSVKAKSQKKTKSGPKRMHD